MSNSALENTLHHTSHLANNVREYVAHHTKATAQVGKQAFSGVVEAVVEFVEYRKREIALGLGTVAMASGAAIVGLQGVAVAETYAERAAANAYENLAPDHILRQEKRAEAMQAGALALAAGLKQTPDQTVTASTKNTATGAEPVAGLAGLLLLGAGAATSVSALRSRARREHEEPTEATEGTVLLAPVTSHRHHAVDAAYIFDSMLDQPYHASRSEEFDDWTGQQAMRVVQGVKKQGQALAKQVSAGAARFTRWRAERKERRAQQLRDSVAAIRYVGPSNPTDLSDQDALQAARTAWERQAFHVPSTVIANGQSLLLNS